MALSVPIATIKLRINVMATKPMPDIMKIVVIAASKPGQWVGQNMHFELPRDTLRFGLQVPCNVPIRFESHCASDPSGRLKLMLTDLSGV